MRIYVSNQIAPNKRKPKKNQIIQTCSLQVYENDAATLASVHKIQPWISVYADSADVFTKPNK